MKKTDTAHPGVSEFFGIFNHQVILSDDFPKNSGISFESF